jgi:hypothetical protein
MPKRRLEDEDVVADNNATAPPLILSPPVKRRRGGQQADANTQERIVKCTLASCLQSADVLMPQIQQHVTNMSKMINKGSLVFARLLLHCVDKRLEMPDLKCDTLYFQCFNVGIGTLLKPIAIVQEVWNTYFAGVFPAASINKVFCNPQFISYAARKYKTNFHNSLFMTLEGRQKLRVRQWCELNRVDKQSINTICRAINGLECRTAPPEAATGLIAEHRQILGLQAGERVNKAWIQQHMSSVVLYFHHILKMLEDTDSKRFTLAPISQIGRQFISIDAISLCSILNGLPPEAALPRVHYTDDKTALFATAFQWQHLSSSKFKFNFHIETDGVAACFHFHMPIGSGENVAGNPSSRPPTVHHNPLPADRRVIAIDPGRKNIMCAAERTSQGAVRTYNLSRNQYYSSAGMRRGQRQVQNWMQETAQQNTVYAESNLKTVKPAQWQLFLVNYASVYDRLWNARLAKKWARKDFRIYCLKRKTLDRFFQSMASPAGQPPPIIAYGAAMFSASGNGGEESVPVQSTSKRCMQHYRTVFIDEFRTSQVCHRCAHRTQPVAKMKDVVNTTTKRVERKMYSVRGLRWCCSTTCTRTFLNRDVNAALNILQCARAGTHARPGKLNRQSPREQWGAAPPPPHLLPR